MAHVLYRCSTSSSRGAASVFRISRNSFIALSRCPIVHISGFVFWIRFSARARPSTAAASLRHIFSRFSPRNSACAARQRSLFISLFFVRIKNSITANVSSNTIASARVATIVVIIFCLSYVFTGGLPALLPDHYVVGRRCVCGLLLHISAWASGQTSVIRQLTQIDCLGRIVSPRHSTSVRPVGGKASDSLTENTTVSDTIQMTDIRFTDNETTSDEVAGGLYQNGPSKIFRVFCDPATS